MRTINCLLLALVCCLGVRAVEGDYQPLVREGVKWVYADEYNGAYDGDPAATAFRVNRTFAIFFSGDTVINGLRYHKCYRTSDVDLNRWVDSEALFTSETVPVAYMREEAQAETHPVYAIRNPELPLAHIMPETYLWDWDNYFVNYLSGNEYLLYYFHADENMVKTGEVSVAGHPCAVYQWQGGSERIVESVGFDGMLGDITAPFIGGIVGYGYSNYALHHMEDASGNVIYKGFACQPMSADFDYSGTVDVDDLNRCINSLLAHKSVDDVTFDVTGDGRVDIDDVNAVINALLAR